MIITLYARKLLFKKDESNNNDCEELFFNLKEQQVNKIKEVFNKQTKYYYQYDTL